MLPLDQRFNEEPPSPENEIRVTEFLKEVFLETASPFEVECRGPICKLTLGDEEVDEPIVRVEVEAGRSGFGLFNKLSLSRDEIFAELNEPQQTAAHRWLSDVTTRVVMSPVIADCKTRSAWSGSVSFSIDLNHSTRTITLGHGEVSIPNDTVSCFATEIQNIAESVPLPREIGVLPDWPIELKVP